MSDIKFDNSKRYIRKNNGQKFGKGVWYRDANNDGEYNSGEQVINIGNRIKNSSGSYVQLNSDGTQTTLFKNGKVTKGVNVTNLDKQAMSKGLIYGRQAINTGNQFKRAKTGKSSWDIDTNRVNQDGNFIDRYGNYLITDKNRRYIGNINSNEILGIDDNSFSNNNGLSFNSLSNSNNTKLITRRYSTQALGQYVNPDNKQKTNFVKVNFGDSNGQNQYLKGNYWVYDDGDGNVQTIGFRGKDGKDYAFVTPTNGGQAFLNSNAKGTILGQTSIGSSRLKSYSAGFTPGMAKWRGKGGWYNNVGTELPSIVYGARDGYLYDKNNRQIGFNANGQYYLKSNTNYEKPSNLHSNFKEGWKGVWGDLNNLASRFDITNNQDIPHRFSGVLGDLGRGVQHIAQGTIGAATQYILPDSWNKVIGKYGQIADLGKDLRTITSGISALTGNGEWVTPWDTKNKGLVDYADIIGDAQGLQDYNDAINGATILLGTRGVGSLKGVVKGSVVADAANIAGKAIKGGYKGAAEVFNNGAMHAGKQTKAGLRPSNIAPIIEQTKEGFKNGAVQGWKTLKANHKKPTQKVTNTSNKKQYISPNTSTKAASNKIPTQAEIQFGEILNNKRPYISPNAKVLPQNDAARIIYNMKFNPKEYANGIINQPRFIIPERPIASNFTPKLNYNAESTVGKVPQTTVLQYVQPKQPSGKSISWQEAVKQKEVAETTKYLNKNLKHSHNKNNKKARTPKPKAVKHYLGGVLTNNRFEKWINL